MSAFLHAASALLPHVSQGLRAASVVLHSGRNAVLANSSLLEDLVQRSGNPGSMHGLAYLIDHEYASRKLPHLVTFLSERESLLGAVLFFEYRVRASGTSVFSTGDRFGVRTVAGPAAWHTALAVKACCALLERRASIVLASFRPQGAQIPVDMPVCNDVQPLQWSVQTRNVQDRLLLARSLDETLARMGKRTRTHLRYYRRRLEESVPCDFLADVLPFIDAADHDLLASLNRGSLDPIAQTSFNLQFRSTAQLPGGFVSGLRTRAGEWLGLAGGWRQGDTTWIQWQTNASSHPSFSIGTAFRAFLMEQEIARGMKFLAFHGGTSHTMHHAFPVEQVVDLIGRRRGVLASTLPSIIPPLYRLVPSLASRGNFLADALRNPDVLWVSSDHLARALQTTQIDDERQAPGVSSRH